MLPLVSQISLERMVNAVEKVRQRLLRATTALQSAQLKYAVVGGNAIAAWVASVDESAVRNTQDVDLLIRREDLPAVTQVLQDAGFVYQQVHGVDLFLDGPQAGPRQAVHIVFANEKVRQQEPASNPDVDQVTQTSEFAVLDLEALVQIKLTAWRDKDRTHLRDLIDVGLIDQSWTSRFQPELAARLQSLLDTPGG